MKTQTLQSFVEMVQAMIDSYQAQHFAGRKKTVTVEKTGLYAHLYVSTSAPDGQPDHQVRWGTVRLSNGDILKANSLKDVRGNVEKCDFACVGVYGVE